MSQPSASLACFGGKVALITGAASGIGQATLVRLVSEGARAIGIDTNEAGLRETVERARSAAAAGGSARAAVADAVVTSVPDPRWTELVTAIVQRRPGSEVSAEALQAHCRGSLAGYKVPKRIVWTERMVRSPAGKADYAWARRYALEQLGG